ncbi:hypothetical protein GF325_14645 [Candidatus Bathyarchaeota archaeon]|nr:hypothetical protein [Candidatus Bathyarchaeota archaeon]
MTTASTHPLILGRIIIIGVVHGQKSCIEETRRVIESEKPEIVAIELPPTFNQLQVNGLQARVDLLSSRIHSFFQALESLGLPSESSENLEAIAVGLALQGTEFLAAIEAAQTVNAKVEFIDMARDKLFLEFAKKIMNDIFSSRGNKGDKIEILPGLFIPKIKLFSLDEVSNFFNYALDDWRETWNELVRVYTEDSYEHLIKDISRLVKKMNESAIFKEILVEHRNIFMVERLEELLGKTTGKIVLVTGFGHVEGIISLLRETLDDP